MEKWLYKQSTGELYRDGKLIETGYFICNLYKKCTYRAFSDGWASDPKTGG
ncbi:hypothetical protein ACGVWS_05490 [Enterobacteriaceae bacterium LUAb1]